MSKVWSILSTVGPARLHHSKPRRGEKVVCCFTMVARVLEHKANINGLEVMLVCLFCKLTYYQSRLDSLVLLDACLHPGVVLPLEHGPLGRGFPQL